MLVRRHGIEAARKQRREFRQVFGVAAFLDVLEIVEAEADDLAWPRHGQRVSDPRKRPPGRRRRAGRDSGERLEIAVVLAERCSEIIRRRRVDRLQINDLIPLDYSEPQSLVRGEGDDFHDKKPRAWFK